MAQFKPVRIGDTVPLQQINPDTEEVDGKIYVSQSGVVLGRSTTGAGPHEEILFADLPGGGGGASYTEITYADMQTAIAGSTLTPGGWYLITDAAGTDLGFLTNAVTENTINVSGVGGYLNADFQAVGDYNGVEAITGVTPGTQLGIWRTGFEQIEIPIVNLTPDSVTYSISSGGLDDAETFTTDLGTTGTVIHDDGAGTVTIEFPSQALVAGEIITGDNSGNTVTVDTYTNPVFIAGDTITGGTTGATAIVVSFDENVGSIFAYMTSPGVAFDGSETLDNGAGVTADQDGAAIPPTIAQGDVVIWNLTHYQLTDATLLDGTDPETNTAAYTQLLKTDADQGYVTAWDVSEFDFANNWIQYRQDGRGNKIAGQDAVNRFQWGNDMSYDNTVLSGAQITQKNSIGVIGENYLYSGAEIGDNILRTSSSRILGNILLPGAELSNNILNDEANIVVNYLSSISELSSCTVGVNSSFQYLNIGVSAVITDITTGDSCLVENNILENGAQLTGITAGSNCSISRNKIGQGATLGGSTTMADGTELNDNTLLSSAYISNNDLMAGTKFNGNYLGVLALIELNTFGSVEFQRNILNSRAYINYCDFSEGDSEISYNVFGPNAGFNSLVTSGNAKNNIIGNGTVVSNITNFTNLSNNSFANGLLISTKDSSGNINGNTIGLSITESETITDNIQNKRAILGFSDIPGTIDITGLTTLDCTAAWAQYRGIYTLTSTNATEAIDTITSPPTLFPFTLRPAAGVVLTVTGTAYSGIAAGQIALKAANYVLDGDKGEYIVLEIDQIGTGCLVEKLVVNGLI